MSYFDEEALESAIMELFKDEEYTHINGKQIQRNKTDILLTDDLKKYLSSKYSLTKNETETIIQKLKKTSGTLYEENKNLLKDISNGFILKREDKKQKDIYINLIDYANPQNNTFKIINQLEIEGTERQIRIPDAVIYINGIPLVVLEFKSAIKENTKIKDAYKQLTIRYKRDIPELLKYNSFLVISDGVNNKYGSLFSPYEFFYSWNKINSEDKELNGINSLTTMIKGLFKKERLLSVIKNYVYFPDSTDSDIKIVCRYPQYFAAQKIYENINTHIKPLGDGKGGTYFGATGCGKSYTMLFLTRILMKSRELKNPTILLLTDRTDLDTQLSKTFVNSKEYIGDEIVESINSRETLRKKLQGRNSGGVFLTTIQKFTEDTKLLTDRVNVICISDEAHRTQTNLDEKIKVTKNGIKRTYGFAKYLHDSLPNATYVGFTGTPIDATLEVFGDIIDSYTMIESVKDGLTVNLVYEGRAAKVTLDNNVVNAIEEYYKNCENEGANEYQIEASKKAVTNLDTIIGDSNRLKEVAKDFINHYETRVKEGATVEGKAMFVCSNRSIAYKLYKFIIEERPEWAIKKEHSENAEISEADKRILKPIEKIKLVMTRTKDDEKELFDILGDKKYRDELDRQFKNVKSNFKIAIVVDMWITGYDVPSLDTIYIDKPIQEHTLIQTISRVNRVYKTKDKGLIVDYIGIKKKMNLALRKYTGTDNGEFEGTDLSVSIVKQKLSELNESFRNFDSTKYFNGTPLEQLNCLNRAVEYVQISKGNETNFMNTVKTLKQAFNLCSASDKFTEKERNNIHFYIAIRSILFKLTTGTAPDISQMNEHVSKLIEQAIQTDGVEAIFETGKHVDIDIFSDKYMDKINAIQLINTKIKVLERLIKRLAEDIQKVNVTKSIEFTERLNNIVDRYNDRESDSEITNDILNIVIDELMSLLEDEKTEKKSSDKMGADYEEKAFYDILKSVANKHQFDYPKEKMCTLAKEIKKIIDNESSNTDWSLRSDTKATLQYKLYNLLNENEFTPVNNIDIFNNDIFKSILEQANNFKNCVA